MIRATCIIRCYNEAKHLGKLLLALEGQSLRPHQVVVVDSGSTDDTLKIAARHRVDVQHIAPRDFSFGRSLNLGCAVATGEVLVMASAHTYPAGPDWLRRLTAPFAADPAAALVYGRQTGDERTRFSEQRVFQRQFPDAPAPVRQLHPYCNNANCAVRCAVWRNLPYDETLTGLEDIDWAARALALGHTLYYAGDAAVVHVHEETPRQIRNRYRREALAWLRMHPADRRGPAGRLAAWLRDLGGDLAAAARARSLRREALGCLGFRTMQHLGAWLGQRDLARRPEELFRTFYYPSAERLTRGQDGLLRPTPAGRSDPAR